MSNSNAVNRWQMPTHAYAMHKKTLIMELTKNTLYMHSQQYIAYRDSDHAVVGSNSNGERRYGSNIKAFRSLLCLRHP